MGEQGTSTAVPTETGPRHSAERRRFQPRFPLEPRPDELAACARPPGWDESGYPVAPRSASLPARMLRLFER